MSCRVVQCGAVQPPNMVRACSVFTILPSKCASRHNGVHFSKSQLQRVLRNRQLFTLLTLKFASRMLRATTACTFSTSELPKVLQTWCFAHFGLEMWFAPQQNALFSTAQLPKVVCDPHFFCTFLTWKCASNHNRVRFFNIPTSKSGLAFVVQYLAFGL